GGSSAALRRGVKEPERARRAGETLPSPPRRYALLRRTSAPSPLRCVIASSRDFRIVAAASPRHEPHLLQHRTAKQAVGIAELFHYLEVVVAFHHGERHRLAGGLDLGGERPAPAPGPRRFLRASGAHH